MQCIILYQNFLKLWSIHVENESDTIFLLILIIKMYTSNIF